MGQVGKSCKRITFVCGTKYNHPGMRCVDEFIKIGISARRTMV